MIFMHIYVLFLQNRWCPLTRWCKHALKADTALKISNEAFCSATPLFVERQHIFCTLSCRQFVLGMQTGSNDRERERRCERKGKSEKKIEGEKSRSHLTFIVPRNRAPINYQVPPASHSLPTFFFNPPLFASPPLHKVYKARWPW